MNEYLERCEKIEYLTPQDILWELTSKFDYATKQNIRLGLPRIQWIYDNKIDWNGFYSRYVKPYGDHLDTILPKIFIELFHFSIYADRVNHILYIIESLDEKSKAEIVRGIGIVLKSEVNIFLYFRDRFDFKFINFQLAQQVKLEYFWVPNKEINSLKDLYGKVYCDTRLDKGDYTFQSIVNDFIEPFVFKSFVLDIETVNFINAISNFSSHRKIGKIDSSVLNMFLIEDIDTLLKLDSRYEIGEINLLEKTIAKSTEKELEVYIERVLQESCSRWRIGSILAKITENISIETTSEDFIKKHFVLFYSHAHTGSLSLYNRFLKAKFSLKDALKLIEESV